MVMSHTLALQLMEYHQLMELKAVVLLVVQTEQDGIWQPVIHIVIYLLLAVYLLYWVINMSEFIDKHPVVIDFELDLYIDRDKSKGVNPIKVTVRDKDLKVTTSEEI